MHSRLRKGFKTILTFSLFLLFLGSMVAQNGENPFELAPRAGTTTSLNKKAAPEVNAEEDVGEEEEEEQKELTSGDTTLENPFALTPASENKEKTKKKNRLKPVETSPSTSDNISSTNGVKPNLTEARTRRLVFSLILLDLILIAVVLTLLRNFFQKSYDSFTNDNLLSQVFRERQAGVLLPFLIFYCLFFYNLALFTFLITDYYELPLNLGPLPTFLYLFLGICLIFFGKHLLLRIVGYIFPVDQELRKYSFTIMIFGIITGFFLLLANLLIAYGPDSLTKYAIYISLIIFALIYFFRTIRGLFIANKFLWFHKFHFLLYICTVEIAPAIIVLKLILNQI